jgi:hypothetical protein
MLVPDPTRRTYIDLFRLIPISSTAPTDRLIILISTNRPTRQYVQQLQMGPVIQKDRTAIAESLSSNIVITMTPAAYDKG